MLWLFVLFVFSFVTFVLYKKYGYLKEKKETVKAKMIRKEINSYSNQMPNRNGLSSMSKYKEYIFIFELENNKQLELLVTKDEYSQFFEGDRGKLSFQGTRYLGFEREI